MRRFQSFGFIGLLIAIGAIHGFSFSDAWLAYPLLALTQLISWSLGTGLILHYSTSKKQAFAYGLAWGSGHFLSATYWVWISLHVYGGMPVWTASIALLTFIAGLGLFPAVASVLIHMWVRPRALRLYTSAPELALRPLLYSSFACVIGISSLWTIIEFARGYLLTGFPWSMTGYAWIDTPLAGWAPLLGVYSLTFWAAFIGATCILFVTFWKKHLQHKIRVIQRWSTWALIAMSLPLLIGSFSRAIQWTTPVGEPLNALLVQTNIDQADKFKRELWIQQQLQQQDLVESFLRKNNFQPDVTIFPEINIPMVQWDLTPEEWDSWLHLANSTASHLLVSLLYMSPRSSGYDIFNSALWIPPDAYHSKRLTTPEAMPRYNKDHLVPFGEFVPYGFKWFADVLAIPIDSMTPGGRPQAPWLITKTQALAVNICFEDVFGENLIDTLRASARSGQVQGNIHVNISNLSWFGQSKAPSQHLWISRMRALETQTPVLRSANTAETAAIDAQGNIIARSEPNTASVLAVTVQGTKGLTPFTRWGNLPIFLATILGLVFTILLARRERKYDFSK